MVASPTPHIIPIEELEIIRDRLHAASARPWRVESDPERIGENWFLFSCGLSADNKQYYVTTDDVPASEDYGDPATDAEFIVWCRNDMGRLGSAYIALFNVYSDLLEACEAMDALYPNDGTPGMATLEKIGGDFHRAVIGMRAAVKQAKGETA
jgi:hypothetical protein